MVGGADADKIEYEKPIDSSKKEHYDLNYPQKLILTENSKVIDSPQIQEVVRPKIRLAESDQTEIKLVKIKLSSPAQSPKIQTMRTSRRKLINKKSTKQEFISQMEIINLESAELNLRSSETNLKLVNRLSQATPKQVIINNYMDGDYISDQNFRKLNPTNNRFKFTPDIKPEERLNIVLKIFY